jgi:hypothetical protein
MPYRRGDIVEVPFIIPDTNRSENHPAIIISNDNVYLGDQIYICAMITHSKHRDMFSFLLENDMLNKPLDDNISQVRCHLITYVLGGHIIPNSHRNKMKPNAVDRLVVMINTVSLESI